MKRYDCNVVNTLQIQRSLSYKFAILGFFLGVAHGPNFFNLEYYTSLSHIPHDRELDHRARLNFDAFHIANSKHKEIFYNGRYIACGF